LVAFKGTGNCLIVAESFSFIASLCDFVDY